MTVDAENDTSHTTADPVATETGSAAPSSTETQAAAAQDPGVSADAAGAQREAGNRGPGTRSSTNPNAIPQNTQPTSAGSPVRTTQPGEPAAKPIVWEEEAKRWQKRFSESQNGSQREVARMQSELAQLRQFRQEQQQQAERLQLKQWSKQHPEHQKFQGTLQKAAVIRQQLANVDPKLPPEQQQAIKDSIVSAMAPEEQQMLQEYQQESQSFQRDFFVDPRGTLAPILQQEIQAAFDQFRMHQQATQLIDKDFKELEPVIEAHRPELASMLQRGTPYDVAMENLRLKAQLDGLRNRAGEVENASMAAQEQQRLAKGKASITRDPVPTSKPDVYTMAKKEATAKGISTDDSRFMGILSRIEANLKNTTPP